ncbi:MAG: prealbumin-like fold domain-containing protein, partial [Smithellaceae bacterium]|nr:prealbumin-like fold domain-containing protein [Smithellaceae bacterium]
PRTMANGQVRILGLKAGEYLVTEVQAPPGYILDQTPVSLTVQRGDAATNAAVLTNAAVTAKTGQSGATFQRLISYGMILTIISATLLLINEIRRLRRRNESETEIHE